MKPESEVSFPGRGNPVAGWLLICHLHDIFGKALLVDGLAWLRKCDMLRVLLRVCLQDFEDFWQSHEASTECLRVLDGENASRVLE